MTVRDPGHAAGNQVYRPPPPPCTCGHPDGVHMFTAKGRGECTAHFYRGRYCGCRGYTPQLAPPGVVPTRPPSGGAVQSSPASTTE